MHCLAHNGDAPQVGWPLYKVGASALKAPAWLRVFLLCRMPAASFARIIGESFQRVIGVNRAWGFKDYNWWKLPLKNLFMIGILISALVLGLVAPLIFNGLRTNYFPDLNLIVGVLPTVLPPAILFYGLLMFYKFAPRRSARFSQVWIAALLATLFLELGQNAFAWYLSAFTNFNVLYGVFGTIMGSLLWIYFSGVILLLGGCIAATIHSLQKPGEAGDSVKSRAS